MSSRARILFFTIILYAGTLAIGITSASRVALAPGGPRLLQLELTLTDAAVFLAVFIAFTFVLLRFRRVSQWLLARFLLVIIAVGARFIFAAWLPVPWDWAAAIGLVVAWRLTGRVLSHDIAIAVGIAGVSAVLGLSITPLVAAVLLAVLSVYDIYSVYRSHHMIALAGRMLASGAIFGFLVPAAPKAFFHRVSAALAERKVLMLGSGDIGLPLVLAASAVTTSFTAAVASSVGALVGVTVMQVLWMRQERPEPMAALPPIAACTITGYLLATLGGF